MKIDVWDSLGNMSSITLTDIWYDEVRPAITNLFPTADTAPKDADNEDAPTIDPVTRNPVFLIEEELDSLSIRYHEQGGGTAIVQDYRPGNSRLETVDKLVEWPVNDTTFIDRQRYDLQILAIDLAGNASVTDGGIAHVQRRLYESGRRYVQGCAGCRPEREAGRRRGLRHSVVRARHNADTCREGTRIVTLPTFGRSRITRRRRWPRSFPATRPKRLKA